MIVLCTTWSAPLNSWLVDCPAWGLWLLSAASVALLVFGADRTVGSAVALARSLGMSTVIVGATVVSLGTTMPEMFASVTAAFRGESGLALGNAVGSIICDTGLIFGLCCVVAVLPLNRFVLNRHGWLQLGAGLLLASICVALAAISGRVGTRAEADPGDWNTIPRAVGVVLVGLLAGYLYLSVRWARQHPETVSELVAEAKPAPAGRPLATLRSFVLLVAGLALIAVGCNLLIPAVKVLAEKHYHVPKDVLAVTVVAFGTSLPELATGIAAVAKGHKELMVGNIVGADILNVLFVVGLSACATELKIPPTFYFLHLPVMVLVLLLLRLYIFSSGGTFRRWQGVPLLLIYVGYVAALVVFAPHMAGR